MTGVDLIRWAWLISLSLLTGCSSIAYYSQSIAGHSRLMLARQPIEQVIDQVDADTRQQLTTALAIRQYAVEVLALPDNQSYQSYVALRRDFPVWVVVAAKPLSLSPKQWCYLVIGCAHYRGYYSQAAAQRYAEKLQAQGWETHVSGAPAYSTLGWFADPLLPSMLRYGDAYLAETIFHELAHQVLYVKNNSDFNEAFATLVGEQGASHWLSTHQPQNLKAYRAKLAALEDFDALVVEVKTQLAKIYQSTLSNTQKNEQKQQVLTQMQTRYQYLKTQKWHGQGWFDNWFQTPINNARLAAFSTYRQQLPTLQSIFTQCQSQDKKQQFEKFYKRLKNTTQNTQELAAISDC